MTETQGETELHEQRDYSRGYAVRAAIVGMVFTILTFAVSLEFFLSSPCKCAIGCHMDRPANCDWAFGSPLAFYFYGEQNNLDGSAENVSFFSPKALGISLVTWVVGMFLIYWFLYRRPLTRFPLSIKDTDFPENSP